MAAIAIWTAAIEPGKPHPVSPGCDVRITNAALADELADENGRTSVKVTFKSLSVEETDDDEEEEEEKEKEEEKEGGLRTTVLCSLTPGKIEQFALDLVIEEEGEYLFEVVGNNTVHLTGNYIDQNPLAKSMLPDEDDDFSDGEDYDLKELGLHGDDDMENDELESDAHRFEEIQEVSLKRTHDDDMVVDTAVSKVSKHKNKKQKGENGHAVPTPSEPLSAELPKATEGTEDIKESKKDKKKKKEKKKDQEVKKANTDASPSKNAWKELPNGLKLKDTTIGTGPQAKAGSTVMMRYIGKLADGTVFDKNVKGKPFTFRLGEGEVIKGWDQGIQGMQVGGERMLKIPPTLGYGNKKNDTIPAGSTLEFECKLLEIK